MKRKTGAIETGSRAAWPVLKEQLTASRVIPGSALEQLIRNNQDFQMLHPNELNDRLPFPPWLRVWWRKAHPELDFSGPKVGYSLILKEIGFWMLKHQDLPGSQSPASVPNANTKPGSQSKARS
jgi:hypothetical protein